MPRRKMVHPRVCVSAEFHPCYSFIDKLTDKGAKDASPGVRNDHLTLTTVGRKPNMHSQTGRSQHPSEYLEGHHNCFLWTKVQQGLDTLDNPMRCAPMDGAGEILTKFSDGPLSERQHAQDCP